VRYLTLVTLTAASVILIGASSAGAGVAGPAGLSQSGGLSSVALVQEKREGRKSETLTERVKRAWKDLVGYKFTVSCPILLPLSRSTCTETGKDREDARAKCASRNPFCYVADAGR
jgi:hypothetical protein